MENLTIIQDGGPGGPGAGGGGGQRSGSKGKLYQIVNNKLKERIKKRKTGEENF